MIDLSRYANATYTVGPPTRATANTLIWDRAPFFTMTWTIDAEGRLIGCLDVGTGRWYKVIEIDDPDTLSDDINEALEDASHLGRQRNIIPGIKIVSGEKIW